MPFTEQAFDKIDNYFLTPRNIEEVEAILYKTVKAGIDFKLRDETFSRQSGIKDPCAQILKKLPVEGKSLDELFDEFLTTIDGNSVNFSSPRFLGFPDSANSVAGLVGHVAYGFLNQNLISSTYTAPSATYAEIAVVNWLREIIGYDVCESPKTVFDVGGISVAGGVSANTIGLLLAREQRFPGTMATGITTDPRRIKVFIPKGTSHYSIRAGLGWLGLGSQNTIEVVTDSNYRICQSDLRNKLANLAEDDIPLALIAYAGDSRTMTCDRLEQLAEVAKEYGLWFHVDGCHGMALCFSEKLRSAVKGIGLADSVTIDPHKVLCVPYASSFLLVKRPETFKMLAGTSDLITKEPLSLGQITPFFGSRPFTSLKLWFFLQHLGVRKIGELVEHRHEFAMKFAELVELHDDFTLMNNVDNNSVVFLYTPAGIIEAASSSEDPRGEIEMINNLNRSIHRSIITGGKFYIHTFSLHDAQNKLGLGSGTEYQMLRVMIGNPLTTVEHLKELLDQLCEFGRDALSSDQK